MQTAERQVSCISAHLPGKALTILCTRLSIQVSLYRGHPWSLELVLLPPEQREDIFTVHSKKFRFPKFRVPLVTNLPHTCTGILYPLCRN